MEQIFRIKFVGIDSKLDEKTVGNFIISGAHLIGKIEIEDITETQGVEDSATHCR